MLRVWMLLVVGAAAMRQAAEDVSAHSAVKEEWVEPISYIRNKLQTSSLRSAAEEALQGFLDDIFQPVITSPSKCTYFHSRLEIKVSQHICCLAVQQPWVQLFSSHSLARGPANGVSDLGARALETAAVWVGACLQSKLVIQHSGAPHVWFGIMACQRSATACTEGSVWSNI